MIALGQTVEDGLTGFKGIAYAITDCLNGNKQFAVMPRAKEGEKYPEAVTIDHQHLRTIDDGLSATVIAATPDPFQLGDLLRDKITNYTGTAVRRTTFMNGCVYYTMEAPPRDTKNVSDEMFATVDRLEKAHTREAPVEAEERPLARRSGTGGPSVKAQQQR